MRSPIKKAKHWLKHHFIPHEGNAHRPHLLHPHNIRDFIGVVFFFELILFVLPILNFTRLAETFNLAAVLPGTLSALTNEQREKNNLPDLVESSILDRAAQLKAEDMAAKSYFAHTSPDGVTPWYWFTKAGYGYLYAGENLAINFADSAEVTEAWMNSPLHRANIVGKNYEEVGTGVATGMYQGREAIFVAQLYGTPLSISHAPPVATVEKATSTREQSTTTVVASQSVLGEAFPVALQTPTFWQRIVLTPERTIAVVLFVMLLIILVALFLNITIGFEHHHPDLIAHALVVVVIIFGVQLANSYVAQSRVQTSFLSTDIPSAVSSQ